MKLRLATIILAFACIAASCKPTHPSAADGLHWAFADSDFTTSLGICNIVAEDFVAHHDWPQSKAQLEEQWRTMLDVEKRNVSRDESTELSNFLSRFTLLEFQKRNDGLIFHFRFKSDQTGKIIDHTITFQPQPPTQFFKPRPGKTIERLSTTTGGPKMEIEGVASVGARFNPRFCRHLTSKGFKPCSAQARYSA